MCLQRERITSCLYYLSNSILSSQQAGTLTKPSQQCIKAAKFSMSLLASNLQVTTFVQWLVFCL